MYVHVVDGTGLSQIKHVTARQHSRGCSTSMHMATSAEAPRVLASIDGAAAAIIACMISIYNANRMVAELSPGNPSVPYSLLR